MTASDPPAEVKLACKGCGASLRVKTGDPSKRRRCPKCGAAVALPAPQDTASNAEPEYGLTPLPSPEPKRRPVKLAPRRVGSIDKRRLGEMLAGFEGEMPRVRVGLGYRLAQSTVGLAVVLLPIVYLAMVCAAAYLLYWHATENWIIMKAMRPVRWSAVAYIAPIVAGVLLLVFMIKPLFARPAEQPIRRTLDPREAPLFVALVRHLCRLLSAPTPRQIELLIEPNAYARPRAGLRSVVTRDLALGVGLPLVRGLSLRQLVGVLAHELGHFSQSGGMVLSYMIEATNAWFARVVYERDTWDAEMDDWVGNDSGYIAAIGVTAKLLIWLTRRLLWVMMITGRILSCVLQRRKELHADRYAIVTAGSEAFIEAIRSFAKQSMAFEAALGTAEDRLQTGRLPDDLVGLTAVCADALPADVREWIDQAQMQEGTGLFDMHPSARDRITQASRLAKPGLCRLDQPATAAFEDFERICRSLTVEFYVQNIGGDIGQHDLMPVREYLGAAAQEERP